MVAARQYSVNPINELEMKAREEWRRLCFVLEGLQATHLLSKCHDKYAFARTYLVYDAEEKVAFARVEASVARGEFDFFIERGVPAKVITQSLAHQLLRDWRASIASKRARIEAAFEGRFGEDIGEFAAAPGNEVTISATPSFDEGNAVWLIGRWSAECDATAR